uniref:Glycolipid transfer protein n=1 Tax=Calidris pygmaea TaxID=425635 RepID=A0A8C3JVA6_9CHAR
LIVLPPSFHRLPGDSHRLLAGQSRPDWKYQENPGGLRLQPRQVQNAAEHPGGGEGDARLGLAQDGRDAGADVVEKVTQRRRGAAPGTWGPPGTPAGVSLSWIWPEQCGVHEQKGRGAGLSPARGCAAGAGGFGGLLRAVSQHVSQHSTPSNAGWSLFGLEQHGVHEQECRGAEISLGLGGFGGPRLKGCLAGGWESASPSPPDHLRSSHRGLKFMLVLLQSISDGERDEEHPNLICVNALKAYEIALKKYHGWMLQKLFMGSVYALPYKSDLLKALEKGKEVKEEESIEKIHQFLSRVTPILDAIYEMYTKMNAELSYKA